MLSNSIRKIKGLNVRDAGYMGKMEWFRHMIIRDAGYTRNKDASFRHLRRKDAEHTKGGMLQRILLKR